MMMMMMMMITAYYNVVVVIVTGSTISKSSSYVAFVSNTMQQHRGALVLAGKEVVISYFTFKSFIVIVT